MVKMLSFNSELKARDMSDKTKEEGRIANCKGISRNKNPYMSWEDTGKAVEWDLGWLMQTQNWAGKPKSMCKGANCTAVHREPDSEHSKECRKEHTLVVDKHFSVF